MDKLPSELLLEIAKYLTFDDLHQLSKANPQWNAVIEANWRTLKKLDLDLLSIQEDHHNKVRNRLTSISD